jgi:DNA-binding response OmpR family regulator
MRVLVVDDEALIALLNEEVLADAGHEVVGPVASAAEALWLARRGRIDLALLDIDLGRGGSGVELARCLHQLHGIRSLFASSRACEARQGSDAALGLLNKPYSPDDLVLAVAAADTIMAGGRPVHVPQGMEVF